MNTRISEAIIVFNKIEFNHLKHKTQQFIILLFLEYLFLTDSFYLNNTVTIQFPV